MTAQEQVIAINHILSVIEISIAALRHERIDIGGCVADVLLRNASDPLAQVRDAIEEASGSLEAPR